MDAFSEAFAKVVDRTTPHSHASPPVQVLTLCRYLQLKLPIQG